MRLRALEDLVHIGSGTPVDVAYVRAVGHEDAALHGFSVVVSVRQPPLSREVDDEVPVCKLVRSRGDEESIDVDVVKQSEREG